MQIVRVASPSVSRADVSAVVRVLKSGQLAQGSEVLNLEKEAAHYVKSRFAVSFCNGTAALYAALAVLDLAPGDEVITTPFTFAATLNVIIAHRAKVVLADIDPQTLNLDPRKVKDVLSSRTKLILPVSLYGLPHDYSGLLTVIKSRRIKIVEDACQSLGATFNNRFSGTLGDLGVTSLYATKVITAGEGGIVFTNDARLTRKLQLLRHHGQGASYEFETFGLNLRMTDVLAALARSQLARLPSFLAKRAANARLYSTLLQGLKGITLPATPKGCKENFYLYTIRVAPFLNRDSLRDYLEREGVFPGIYYPRPLHLTRSFRFLGYHRGNFPESEAAACQVLSLPVHPRVGFSQVRSISRLIRKYVEKNS